MPSAICGFRDYVNLIKGVVWSGVHLRFPLETATICEASKIVAVSLMIDLAVMTIGSIGCRSDK